MNIHTYIARIITVFLVVVLHSPPCSAQRISKQDSLGAALAGLGTDTAKVRLLLALSNVHKDSAVVKALYYANEALNLSEKIKWTEGKMYAELAIGLCYPQVLEYDKAIEHYSKAIVYSKQITRPDIEVKLLQRISFAYKYAGNLAEAINYYKLAIPAARQVNDLGVTAGSL